MDVQIFRELGLTEGETKVYNALLLLGLSTVGPLAKEADVSLSKIYEILEGLIRKGFASYTIKNRTRYYKATDPDSILLMLKEKEEKLRGLTKSFEAEIPKFKEMAGAREPIFAEIFEGFRGIKSFYEEIIETLQPGEEIFFLGIPKTVAEEYEGYFMDWNLRRSRKGIKIKALFEAGAKEAAKKRLKFKHTDIRILPRGVSTPAWIIVFHDTAAIAHIGKNAVCFAIRDKEIAESYRNNFKMLWEGSAALRQ
ncbi:MAG: helix-turn-helix domain-containing protein [Candidatus Micrarchaeia archaeon]